MTDRRQDAYAIRLEAAELARSRNHETHKANGDEQRYAGAKYFMSFTKGLPHNPETGLLADPQDFVEFRRAIDDGFIDPFTDRVRHGARYKVNKATGQVEDVLRPNAADEAADQAQEQEQDASKKDQAAQEARQTAEQDIAQTNNFRQWEAPTAGVAFDLEGPDAQAVTMPPAPPLMKAPGIVNPELALEMAEVYELAILRDTPFTAFETTANNVSQTDQDRLQKSIENLNKLDYIQASQGDCCEQLGRPRKVKNGLLDQQTVFRGSSPGVEVGPYLSQFLLMGNLDRNKGGKVAEGLISYGVLQVDQKVPIAEPGKNYMVNKQDYVNVQRGLTPPGETYVSNQGTVVTAPDRPGRRFMSTPRDLATYVHYDALYEAYLNACLILLDMGTPLDPAFDQLSGGGVAAGKGLTRRHASGFALYGGPHVLTLVTEVATRALKAVRFQKYNNHIRLRPEALAARLELVRTGSEFSGAKPTAITEDMGQLAAALKDTLADIQKISGNQTHFLPMAFPEGSPMHPAYGAGHATVAGACVTILKAFFDTSAVLATNDKQEVAFRSIASKDKPIAYRPPAQANAPCLDEGLPVSGKNAQFLTLEGELNKLAANISIGRDMAGVHFFSDYYDSLRMGEEIAIGMLEEQALTYPTDAFVLSIPTFDGDVVRIGRR